MRLRSTSLLPAFLTLFFLASIGLPSALAQEMNTLALGNYYRHIGWDKLAMDDIDSALYFNRKALANGPIDNAWAKKLEAERQYFQAHKSMAYQEFSDAIAHVERTEQMVGELGAWGDTLRVYAIMKKGLIYVRANQQEKAEAQFTKAYEGFKELKIEDSRRAGSLFVNWGLLHLSKGKYDKAIEHFEKGAEIYKKSEKPSNLELSKVYLNLGTVNLNQANVKAAVDNFEDGLYYLENARDKNRLQQGKLYYNLGAAMIRMKDFESASRYIYAAKDIYQEINDPREFKTFALLSIIYNETGQWDKAIEYTQFFYRKAVGLFGPNSTVSASALGNIAEFYLSKGDIENARLYNQKAWEAINNMDDKPVFERFVMSQVDATIEAKAGNVPAMEKALNLCHELGKNLSPNPNALLLETHVALSNIFYEKGDYERALKFGEFVRETKGKESGTSAYYIVNALMGQNRLEEADENIQKAYEVLQVELDLDAPKIKHKSGRLRPSKVLVQNLTLTGQYYMKKAPISKDKQDWLRSYNAYTLAADYLDSLRRMNKTFETQTELLKEKHRVFEQGLIALYELNQLDPQDKWVKKALEFSEKSKAILLSESLNAHQALKFSGIPEEAQKEERDLRREIYYLQKQVDIARNQSKPALQAKIEGWNQKVFELNKQYEELAASLSKKYPEYMEIRYQPAKINVDQLLEKLREDEALVEYFVGDSVSFAIVLTKEKIHIKKMASPAAWASNIRKLRSQLFQHINFQEKAEKEDSYPRIAHALYAQIWEPLSDFDLPEKILIVPDGPLGYLSFDILLSSLPTQEDAYKNMPYLIRDHQFRYTYSGRMLQYEKENGSIFGKEKFIAFAPEYPSGDAKIVSLRGDLVDLPYAFEEAKNANSIMKGKLLSGDDANESNFKQMAHAYKIIHIAAHAQVDDENPLYSSIFFTPNAETSEDQSLEVFELFNMDLVADLIVLSACETGVGEVKQGEGMISLAWGAAYAGAKSILTSLWQVNDRSTSQIIQQFYAQLEEGLDKDEALRNAKLEYIQSGDHLTAHPFYWGGFILVGDAQPFKGWNLYLILGISGLIALGVGVGVYFSNRS